MLAYVLCARCGLAFQSPRLSGPALQHYYRREYYRREHSAEPDPAKDRWVQALRAEHLAEAIRAHRNAYRTHLDFGCSTGVLLQAFQQAFGTEGFGVEPGEVERSVTAQRGFGVADSLDGLSPESMGSFDLVSFSHVLEHLPDPVESLRAIRETWLAPDGLVVVETPNLFGHPSFELGHTVAFTARTLRLTLAAAGLATLELRSHGKPYSRYLPLFLLAICRPDRNSLAQVSGRTHLGTIRLRRWAGLLLTRSARLLGRTLLGKQSLQPWTG
jgi:SAM-dependent methyltransferase